MHGKNRPKGHKQGQALQIFINRTVPRSCLNFYLLIVEYFVMKLDGVAKLITDPPPTSFTTLSEEKEEEKNKKKNVTLDM